MELVIKIPEELYKAYKGRPPMLGDAGMDMIAQAIVTGTPLPEGHGALKDADEIKKNKFTLGTSNYCEYKVVKIEDIDKADTIIEADKPAPVKEKSKNRDDDCER